MISNQEICVACYYNTIEDIMKEAHDVYSNLQSILLLQEMKPCLIDKIVDGEKLYSYQVKNLEDFLNQGKKYLNLANDLDEYNQENQMIFAIMLKALDIYSRLKIQFLSIFDENVNSDEYSDDEIFSDVDIGEENIDLFDAVLFDDILNSIHDYIIDKKLYCKIMLIKIESLIIRIQNVYVAFIRNRCSFDSKLMVYCKNLRLFLSNDAEIVKLNKLERSQMRNIYCKYNLLKQLLERITEIGSRNRDTVLNMI